MGVWSHESRPLSLWVPTIVIPRLVLAKFTNVPGQSNRLSKTAFYQEEKIINLQTKCVFYEKTNVSFRGHSVNCGLSIYRDPFARLEVYGRLFHQVHQ